MGQSLKDKLKHSYLPATEAAQVLSDLAKGLVSIHKVGIVHRDLKPGKYIIHQ